MRGATPLLLQLLQVLALKGAAVCCSPLARDHGCQISRRLPLQTWQHALRTARSCLLGWFGFFFIYLQVTVCGWQSISPLPHKRRQSPGPIASEAAVNMILKLPRFQGSRALEGTVNIVRLAINLQELISLYSQLFK